MKASLIVLMVVGLLAAFSLFPELAEAQINNPLGPNATLEGLLVKLTNWLLGIVGILSVLGIVYGGVRMVAAVGDEGQLASAKKIVLWSIAGVVVAILALTIVNIVATQILGVAHTIPTAMEYIFGANALAVDIGLDVAQQTGLDPLKPEDVAKSIVRFVLSIIGLIVFLVIIWGGFQYVLSLGDEQKTAHAKRIILYGIIGLVVIGLSAIIVNAVISLFNPS